MSGLIARVILKAEKGHKSSQTFWDARPFTRVAAWGKAYDQLKSYLRLNTLEALGFFPYQSRDKKGRRTILLKIEPFTMAGNPR